MPKPVHASDDPTCSWATIIASPRCRKMQGCHTSGHKSFSRQHRTPVCRSRPSNTSSDPASTSGPLTSHPLRTRRSRSQRARVSAKGISQNTSSRASHPVNSVFPTGTVLPILGLAVGCLLPSRLPAPCHGTSLFAARTRNGTHPSAGRLRNSVQASSVPERPTCPHRRVSRAAWSLRRHDSAEGQGSGFPSAMGRIARPGREVSWPYQRGHLPTHDRRRLTKFQPCSYPGPSSADAEPRTRRDRRDQCCHYTDILPSRCRRRRRGVGTFVAGKYARRPSSIRVERSPPRTHGTERHQKSPPTALTFRTKKRRDHHRSHIWQRRRSIRFVRSPLLSPTPPTPPIPQCFDLPHLLPLPQGPERLQQSDPTFTLHDVPRHSSQYANHRNSHPNLLPMWSTRPRRSTRC